MDLKTYLEDTTQQALCDLIKEDDLRLIAKGKRPKNYKPGITQGAIHQWLINDLVPPGRVMQLVRVSKGAMVAELLNPEFS